MEQWDRNLLFRWFVGLEMDDPVWDATVCRCAGSPVTRQELPGGVQKIYGPKAAWRGSLPCFQ